MSFPSWLKGREKPERVAREAVIMQVPQVSFQEWAEAASQYRVQAGQIAFAVGSNVTGAERLLDRAEKNFQSNTVSQGESLVWSAIKNLRGSNSPDCLQGWARAAMVAASSSDDELRSAIAEEGSARLLENGLDDVAVVFKNYSQVYRQFGPQTARVLGSGVLSAVNSWCLREAMEPSAHQE